MGVMTKTKQTEIQRMIKHGHTAAGQAQAVREETRWSAPKSDLFRAQALAVEIERLGAVMQPIRREIGRIAWSEDSFPPDMEANLRAVSQQIQYERKQLKKMLRRTNAALSGPE